jgi:hypothetical protein
MNGFELLATRVKSEYREMPGLHLTFAQACRLWQMDPNTCEAVLRSLVDEQFLRRTADGAYVAWPTRFARPLPARPLATAYRRPAV